ncbi:GNAT family N-acetyltransferase [Kribbella catacumbae]|uniref:GNAT family N-acetyltransferase n=1 Tax=Kribbella catacumbae TaxID=460086 RepID=UPI00047808F6|nr:GNAT family N-acetyltransferase [Kribbella catacumbae]
MIEKDHWPAGLIARPIEPIDVQAWSDLMIAKNRADQDSGLQTVDDLLEELGDPVRDVTRDTVGLWSGDLMVGYCMLRAGSQFVNGLDVHALSSVHPLWRRRGLGTAIVDWMIQRSTEMHEALHTETPGKLNTNALTSSLGAEALLMGFGFKTDDHYLEMECPLDTTPCQTPLPGRARIVPFQPEHDEAVRLLHNEAFRDHRDSLPTSAENWRLWVTGSRAFVGSASSLVFVGDQLIAYALSYDHSTDDESGTKEIHIGQVGTARPYRGRGFATAAVSWAMAEAQRAGFQRASLSVDSESPTGAVGLYERLGFQTKRISAGYQRPIP